ncbi:lambda-exonuclease family protein [Nocardioides alcanivorans]|uniref:lambda-exonuclease family protein n=1 Tax=Nocardioides alcanivorans TaxID=2897352 RepID=UPI001F323E67|nr:YqaJ viral recombinase family protein [Nocardioides alcanivorans]
MTDLTPGSPEWRKKVTASKVAAILGLSPWESPRSLWHLMRGDIDPATETDTHRRGHYLEPAILAWWRDQHGITDMRQWADQPSYELGDWAAATPDAMTLGIPGLERVLVEAKSTAQDWGGELPAYYLTQVIWQMHVSGIHRCYVPVIGPRLTFEEYVVDYADYAEDAELIERKAREFYDSLSADTPPDLDDSVATYDAVRRVHPEIDKGETVELTREQADDLVTFAHLAKETETSLRLAKSTVIDAMARAQYAEHNGIRIARRQAGKHGVTFVVVGKPENLTPMKDAS